MYGAAAAANGGGQARRMVATVFVPTRPPQFGIQGWFPSHSPLPPPAVLLLPTYKQPRLVLFTWHHYMNTPVWKKKMLGSSAF